MTQVVFVPTEAPRGPASADEKNPIERQLQPDEYRGWMPKLSPPPHSAGLSTAIRTKRMRGARQLAEE
jgi:hypothetical protein